MTSRDLPKKQSSTVSFDSFLVVRQNPKVISRKIASQWLILEPDKTHIRTLNESAGLIWEFLKKPSSIKLISKKLSSVYKIPLKTACRDAELFVKEYLDKGLLISSPYKTSK